MYIAYLLIFIFCDSFQSCSLGKFIQVIDVCNHNILNVATFAIEWSKNGLCTVKCTNVWMDDKLICKYILGAYAFSIRKWEDKRFWKGAPFTLHRHRLVNDKTYSLIYDIRWRWYFQDIHRNVIFFQAKKEVEINETTWLIAQSNFKCIFIKELIIFCLSYLSCNWKYCEGKHFLS